MAPRLRKHSFLANQKSKNGDFARELKKKVGNFKIKPMKAIRPKKATHFTIEKVKLKSVSERKLQPTPPKQKNLFEKLVEDGIAFRNAKEATKAKESESDIDYSSLQIKEILGATDIHGKLQFLVEWKKSQKCDLIDAAVINKYFAQQVIQFYQKWATFE